MTSGLDRRRFLGLGIGLAAPLLAGAGCSVTDPRIVVPGRTADPRSDQDPASGDQPSPSPSPTFAGSTQGAEAEQRLAGLAAALLTGPWRRSLGSRKALLVGVEAAHLEHATALLGEQPTNRPTAPPADPIKPTEKATTLEAAFLRLRVAEQKQAVRHRKAALGTTGTSSLLWGSMSVAASSYAAALRSTRPVAVRKPKAHVPLPQLSDVEAAQELVRQLHAIVYGYQLAIGRLTDRSAQAVAVARLREQRILLDALTSSLVSRGAAVPAAEPAYEPGVDPRSSASAARLIKTMEIALAPFCGLWLAAATNGSDRGRAFTALADTVATGLRWGASIRAWPGWTG